MKKQTAGGREEVDLYMEKLDHSMKSGIELLRDIIRNANPKLQERVKWNAPSFYYVKDLCAFHLRPKDYIQIVFVFYDGNMIESPGLLEGAYKDRRLAKFHSMEDIEQKRPALERFVNDWVALIDR